jgi:glycosyltransferase involved in cell wall biosynthesis
LKKKISIVCPAYNSAKYIHYTIQSLLNQSFKEFELIIVVDPSIDETIKEIKKFKDKRIVLIVNKSRLGLVKSLNLAIKKSSGDIIARADSDDLYFKDRLKEQYSYLIKNPEIDLVGSDCLVFDDKKKLKFFYPKTNNLIKWGMTFFCPFAHPSIMLRKKIFYKYNFYKNKVEDYDLYTRLINKIKFENMSGFLCAIRKHESNSSTPKDDTDFLELRKIYKKFIFKMYKLKVKAEVVEILIHGKERVFSKKNLKDSIRVIKELRKRFLKKFPENAAIVNVDVVLRIIVICFKNVSFYNFFSNLAYFFQLDKIFFYHLFLKLINRYLKKKCTLIGVYEK